MEAADHGWPLAAIGNDHIPKSISGRASRRAMDFPIDQREGAEVMDPCRRNLKRTARSFPPHFKKNGNRWLIVVAWANNLAVTHVLYTAGKATYWKGDHQVLYFSNMRPSQSQRFMASQRTTMHVLGPQFCSEQGGVVGIPDQCANPSFIPLTTTSLSMCS